MIDIWCVIVPFTTREMCSLFLAAQAHPVQAAIIRPSNDLVGQCCAYWHEERNGRSLNGESHEQ